MKARALRKSRTTQRYKHRLSYTGITETRDSQTETATISRPKPSYFLRRMLDENEDWKGPVQSRSWLVIWNTMHQMRTIRTGPFQSLSFSSSVHRDKLAGSGNEIDVNSSSSNNSNNNNNNNNNNNDNNNNNKDSRLPLKHPERLLK